MAYVRTTWEDRLVEKPFTYSIQNNEDGSITLIPSEGTVTTEGTKVNAENMNNIETGMSEIDTDITNLAILYSDLETNKADKLLPPWTDVTPTNNWTHDSTNPCQYYKDDMGMVHFRGRLNPGTKTSGVILFVLPEEFRPKKDVDIITKMLTTNVDFVTLNVRANGNCTASDKVTNITKLYFDNIHYRTDA